MYLQDFVFNIEHRAGDRMKHVDGLSRFPVMLVTSEIRARICKAQQEDDHLRQLLQFFSKNRMQIM